MRDEQSIRYTLAGLDCASCANKIEQELRKVEGLEGVNVNFAGQSVELPPELAGVAQETIHRVEPGVRLAEQVNRRPRPVEDDEGEKRSLCIIACAGLPQRKSQ